jgi:hypothetical protein
VTTAKASKAHTRTIVALFVNGPLKGQKQTVPANTLKIDVGRGIPFWTYVRLDKRLSHDGTVKFGKLPRARILRRLMSWVKK